MKRELFNQWVSALRSGKYEQGKGLLCKNNKFCCLGVFLDIINKSYKTNAAGVRMYEGRFCQNVMGILSDQIVEEYGFYSSYGNHIAELGDSLASLNDVKSISFNGIADILEFNPSMYVKLED